MTQPYQYDPSQQPGQPSAPYDPAAQPPPGPHDQQPGPYAPQQPPGQYDPQQAAQQPPGQYDPQQAPQSPFGPTAEQPGFGPPPSEPGNFLPPAPPKKKRGGLFIVLGIVVLLLIGGGIGVAIWRPWAPAAEVDNKADKSADDDGKDSADGKKDDDKKDDGKSDDEGVPSQVVEDAWYAPSWDEAKGFMSEELVTELEKSGAAEEYQPIGDDEEFNIVEESIDGEESTVTVETTVSAEGEAQLATIEVKLIKEDKDWLISEIGEPQ